MSSSVVFGGGRSSRADKAEGKRAGRALLSTALGVLHTVCPPFQTLSIHLGRRPHADLQSTRARLKCLLWKH